MEWNYRCAWQKGTGHSCSLEEGAVWSLSWLSQYLLWRVLRRKLRGVSLWSHSIVIPEWPHLMVVFCEMVYLQWNSTALLLGPADAFRELFLSNSHFWSRADKVRVQDRNPDIEMLTMTRESGCQQVVQRTGCPFVLGRGCTSCSWWCGMCVGWSDRTVTLLCSVQDAAGKWDVGNYERQSQSA